MERILEIAIAVITVLYITIAVIFFIEFKEMMHDYNCTMDGYAEGKC